jgi:LTXXQ motif family protein
LQPPAAQVGECIVGANERIWNGLRHNFRLRHDCKEFLAVLPGQISDRFKFPLLPENAVRKTWNIAHVNSGADDAASFADRAQRRRDKHSDRCIDYGAVERLGWRVIGTSHPACAKLFREFLRGDVACPGESEHLAALPARDLRDDVRGGTKAVESNIFAVSSHLQRAPPDQAGAQKRRQRDIIAVIGQRQYVSRIRNDVRGITAVTRIACKQWPVAEVFTPFAAIPAMSAGLTKPRNADAAANLMRVEAAAHPIDPSDNFVAGNDGKLRIWQVAVDDVKIGAAHAAGGDTNPYFAVGRPGVGALHKLERRPRTFQHHRTHLALAFSWFLAWILARLPASLAGCQILGRYFSSIKIEQKKRFDSMEGSGKAATERTNLATLCGPQSGNVAKLPFERVELLVRPDAQQQQALDDLKKASADAANTLRTSCPAAVPQDPAARLDAVKTRLASMMDALKTIRPKLEAFYNSLNDEQKARFNIMGPASQSSSLQQQNGG